MSDFNTIPTNQENVNNVSTEVGYEQEYTSNETPITFEDIILQSVGLDEYDNPKSGFGLEIGTFDATTNNSKMNVNLTYYNPYINITRTGEMMMVDFVFKNRVDSDLRAIWALINKYGKDFENALRAGSNQFPLIRLQIVPNFYSGKYSIVSVAPLYWALQPEIPNGEINTIRLVFGIDSVAFIEQEGYDERQILAEIEREEMQRDFIEQATENRQIEEQEYQEQRNKALEELRRKGEL